MPDFDARNVDPPPPTPKGASRALSLLSLSLSLSSLSPARSLVETFAAGVNVFVRFTSPPVLATRKSPAR